MNCITTETLASVDTASMETKHRDRTPILEAVLQQHRDEDRRLGVDPYNTGRHRALRLSRLNTEEQLRAAEDILVGRDTEGWL